MLTAHEILKRVNAGEVVIANNDWTYELRKVDGKFVWERVWDTTNWRVFDYLTQYHPEVLMDNDGDDAGVMWLYLRK